jgi:hypothetical protein
VLPSKPETGRRHVRRWTAAARPPTGFGLACWIRWTPPACPYAPSHDGVGRWAAGPRAASPGDASGGPSVRSRAGRPVGAHRRRSSYAGGVPGTVAGQRSLASRPGGRRPETLLGGAASYRPTWLTQSVPMPSSVRWRNAARARSGGGLVEWRNAAACAPGRLEARRVRGTPSRPTRIRVLPGVRPWYRATGSLWARFVAYHRCLASARHGGPSGHGRLPSLWLAGDECAQHV